MWVRVPPSVPLIQINFVIRDKEFEKTTTQKIKRYGDNMKNKD